MGAAHHGDHGTDDQTDDQGNDRDYEGVLQTFEDVQVTVVLQEVRVEPVLELLPPSDVLCLLIRVARIAAVFPGGISAVEGCDVLADVG